MLYTNPTRDPASITAAIDRLGRSRAAAVDWLVSRIDPHGKPVGADQFNYWYRLPWSLAMAGRLVEASKVMTWVEREALVEGDLRPGAHQTPWTVEAAPYPVSIIAIGAWHLERYGTADQLLDTLRGFQDPQTGGAYVERPEHRATGRQDLLCTAQLGLTALTTGREEMADRAFEWIERLWNAQPSLPERLYLCWGSDGLITDFDEGEAFGRVIKFDQARQAFFNPGIGAAFLARYYRKTGNETALVIGRALLELTAGGTSLQYDFPDTIHVGKFAWGAAAMLDVEPSDTHLADVLSMADWCIDSQLEDGSWDPSAFLVPRPEEHDTLWKTGEHVMIISHMLAALGGVSTAEPAAVIAEVQPELA